MKTFRVIDIETTGMEPPCEVIEFGSVDVRLADGEAWLDQDEMESCLYGCTAPCPPEVVAVHHLTAADLEGFNPCTPADLRHHVSGAHVIVAHNAEFECRWFTPAILDDKAVICTLKAASRVWPDAPGHGNQVLRYWLGLDLDPALAMPPHRAAPDAYVTAHIFMRLLDHATVEEMIAWTKEPRVMPTCPIGKFRGQKWVDVEAGFLNWMLNQPTMEADLKWNATRELERRRAAR